MIDLLRKKPATFFMHLPKCGGSTAELGLRALVAPDKVLRVRGLAKRNAEKFISLGDAERKKYDLVTGHQYFGLQDHMRKNAQVVTLLREPRARAVSFYNFSFRAWRNKQKIDRVREQQPSFTEIFREEFQKENLDNGAVRFLSGASWQEVPHGACDDSVYEQALQNLHKISMIGMLYEFDKSMLLFRKAMKAKSYPIYEKKNVTEQLKDFESNPIIKLADVSEEEWATVDPFIKWDMMLYEEAKLIFEKQLAENADYLEEHLPIFQEKLKSTHAD